MATDPQAASLEAGSRALERGAWAMARLRFSEALADEETPDGYEGLGRAARYQLDAAGAFDAHERGYKLARAHADTAAAARLAVQLGYDAHAFRGPAEARGWVERAGMLVEGEPPTLASAYVPMLRAHLALLAEHDPESALSLSQEALELARELGAVEVEMLSLALNGLAQVSLGDVDAGMRQLDAAAAAALGGEMSDVDAIETVCCFVIDACRRVRDLERAREWCERVRDVATRYDDHHMFSICRISYADVLMWQGDWELADEELTAAAGELARIRPGREADANARLAELRRRQGRTAEAEQLAAAAEAHRFQALVQGQLALDHGDGASARDAAARFLRQVGEGDRFERVAGLELMTRAAIAAGDNESADAAVAELGAIADVTPNVPLRAAARLAAGRVAAAGGRAEEASPLLEEAADLFDSAGARYDAALARLELAAALRLSNRARAAKKAEASAQEALDELGARPPSTRPGGLSEREMEVLRLLARGASNDDIAHELVLSVRTVERHTSNLYAKVGASGRSARAMATAWANSHGIT
jgi:LuxR family transcriptional regulator, maltose regulon positive regulatory protein